jgi:hypothetical protein
MPCVAAPSLTPKDQAIERQEIGGVVVGNIKMLTGERGKPANRQRRMIPARIHEIRNRPLVGSELSVPHRPLSVTSRLRSPGRESVTVIGLRYDA